MRYNMKLYDCLHCVNIFNSKLCNPARKFSKPNLQIWLHCFLEHVNSALHVNLETLVRLVVSLQRSFDGSFVDIIIPF